MKSQNKRTRALLALGISCISLAAAGAASAGINIATVPVGNPGNAADPATGFGSVGYGYNIGKFDVTAGQYTAFLNAVAGTSDTYGLYHAAMAPGRFAACGIVQTAASGGFTYSVSAQDQNYPVNNVTWGDAARFCNWMTNGQPTGNEGNGTTETGSYTLNGDTSNTSNSTLVTATRNPNAVFVIPTENEWYKAAYYNPSTSGFYRYANRSSSTPNNVLSATGTNSANFYDFGGNGNGGYTDPTNYLTPVGAFADSSSPYGTYDQNGDVFQWNESVYSGSSRGQRGGAFDSNVVILLSSNIDHQPPATSYAEGGFRVVQVSQVPEPVSTGLLGCAVAGLLALRRRAGRQSAPPA